jgi:predicted amidohydrolase YtcJ
MLKAGVKVTLESDSNSYLWDDLRIAINRKDRAGRVWGPQDRVDRPTSLRMLTRWAADYFLKGDQIGSIEKGKSADLVVLDKDYMTIPEDDISTIKVMMTVFDGKPIYLNPGFSTEYNLKPATALVTTYEDLVKTRKPRSGASTGG